MWVGKEHSYIANIPYLLKIKNNIKIVTSNILDILEMYPF